MSRTNIVALLACSLAAGCAAGPPSAPAVTVPLYPYWPLARLPGGPRAAERPPGATAAALLVAPGYLLTSIEGMGAVADDFGLDPTVYVFDGAEWHVGRYVDRDKALRVALIRADVPGTPVALPREPVRPARLLGIAPLAAPGPERDSREWRVVPCGKMPRWLDDELGRSRDPSLCTAASVTELPGGVMVGASGEFAGIQVNRFGGGESAGPDAAEIRAYLDLYFATWGAAVKPKPPY